MNATECVTGGRLSARDALDYEVRSSWWAAHIGWPPLQRLAGRYFAWKVARRWDRYQRSLAEAARVRDFAARPRGG